MGLFDPTTVLLGVAIILLTAATTLALLVKHHPPAERALFPALIIGFSALIGVAALDLGGAGVRTVVAEETALLSLAAATHRRLLLMLPVLLTGTSLFVLAVYHERIAEKHARDYRNTIAFSSGFALIASVVVAVEAML